MCCAAKKAGCQRPDELKGKPEECPPKKIKRCHGATASHPCIPKKKEKK